jgi:hypothetical protein
MRNNENWERFARSGQVSDYLVYAGVDRRSDRAENTVKEERGQRERTCDGNGTFRGYDR